MRSTNNLLLLCGTQGIGVQIKTSWIKVSLSTCREQEQQYLRTPSLSLSSGLSSSSSSSLSDMWEKTSRSRSMSSCNSKLGWSSNDILVLSPGQEALLWKGASYSPFVSLTLNRCHDCSGQDLTRVVEGWKDSASNSPRRDRCYLIEARDPSSFIRRGCLSTWRRVANSTGFGAAAAEDRPHATATILLLGGCIDDWWSQCGRGSSWCYVVGW